MKTQDLKLIVQEKYSEIAQNSMLQNSTACCGSSGCCDTSGAGYSMIDGDYSQLEGYHPDADLHLGCGIPTGYAGIKEGDAVLDLGSGAGNDCFVARAIVGDKGSVTGLDFTEAMVTKARANNEKMGYTNVQFIQGDIEEMPLPDNAFDVIVSNCVLNLVPDKEKAFSNMFRVLKPGGHFCISDVVIKGTLPEKLQKDAEMYVGCVAGAMLRDDYLELIRKTGFENIVEHQLRETPVPLELLAGYLSPEEMKAYQNGFNGIFSLTVSGYKPV
ncbi:MAG: arsenite methyltransferase [Prolixibacteraceae bacterium]|nr:arsenite methyltransferase [Prolixibacteraceae bacterium]